MHCKLSYCALFLRFFLLRLAQLSINNQAGVVNIMRTLMTPIVTVDLDILENNIQEMGQFAAANGVALRPHIKTHKSSKIAKMQLAHGATGITVATVREAEAMAAAGFDDIFIAYTVVGENKLEMLARLSETVRIGVAADSIYGVKMLSAVLGESDAEMDVMIEIDTGQHRCGVTSGADAVVLARLVEELPGLNFRGIMTHEGHSYGAQSPAEVEQIGRQAAATMRTIAAQLTDAGFPPSVVSMGSTPTAHIVGKEAGVTEIRPGNYVFHDRTQLALGSARLEQCALRVIAHVVSNPEPGRVVLDCGSKTLSSDLGKHGPGVKGYGLIIHKGRVLEEAVIERLSEEHGVVTLSPDSNLAIGDVVEVIPNHACVVANLAEMMAGVRKGRLADWIPVES
jgi:D-serine deaminase-like pyridoxal phosphate-dependent protein